MNLPPHGPALLPTKWGVAGGDSVTWREWDGEFVVYIVADASTHLLDAAAGTVLKTLSAAPGALSAGEIGTHGFGVSIVDGGAALSGDESASLQAILLDLERIGVVEQHAS